MTCQEFLKKYYSDNAVIKYFINTRYPQDEKCPYYGAPLKLPIKAGDGCP